ncbi:MAG: ACT domain-containing protein [Spirochaetales bacterium]|jgi:ACT domain-containing protein|nr:ACT domain-containing protein [Spirochaetales bacterium]
MKAFITVIGRDRIGIIAEISAALAENRINILDINQTVMAETFTMIMMVDISLSEKPFSELQTLLDELGEQLKLSIQIQHEDIFNSMHRI